MTECSKSSLSQGFRDYNLSPSTSWHSGSGSLIGSVPVHHSSFVDGEGISKACGCPLLPLKTDIEGPAPVAEEDSIDIVDEAITFYRANVFFKNFDIKSSADKLLIYLTLYINVALKRLEDCRTLAEGTKAIINLGNENVPVPGEKGFPFPWLFSSTKSQKEAVVTVPLDSGRITKQGAIRLLSIRF
nr:Actin-related protein 2/3 complex subunit 3 [Ipomoea batatas]